MAYYPIYLDLKDKKAVVIGGGLVAQRKIKTLLEYGAKVTIVTKDLTDFLKELSDRKIITYKGRKFSEECLDGAFIVIAATDDPELNHTISETAEQRGILINAVDQPADCNFIVPSILRRGDFMISISTSGKSPALAKKVREKLEEQYGLEYELFLNIMGKVRKALLSKGLSQDYNKRIFEKLVNSDILNSIAKKNWSKVTSVLNEILKTQLSRKDLIKYMEVE